MTAMTALDIEKSNSSRRRPAPSCGRRRRAHPRPSRQLSAPERLPGDAAEDGAAARAQMEGLAFDCIILDVMMPGESGFEVAERLAEGIGCADPDADGEVRARASHQGAGAWRRRLYAETVRAARASAQAAKHPEAALFAARPRLARSVSGRSPSICAATS